MTETEQPMIRQDGVRLHAHSPSALANEMQRRRAFLRDTVTALRPEGCQIYARDHFDGVWAAGLLKAVTDLGATGIEVNEWWASLAPDWLCPCCQRPKADIVHLSNGVLIAKAVEHHDHFTSYVSRSFTRDLGAEWGKNKPHLQDIQRQITDTFSAFSPVMICESCNQADRDAKTIVGTHLKVPKDELEYFSFSVDEIRSFIRPAKNRHHAPDSRKVVKVFETKRKREALRFRIETVDQQVRLAVQNIHWRSPESHPSGGDVYEGAWDLLNELGMTPGGNFDFLAYSATTRTGTMPANTWRRNRDRRTTPPSEAKIKEYLAARPHLSGLGTTWRCPCCNRSLFSIIRMNNKRQLTMLINPVGRGDDRIKVCMDCLDVWRGLAKEARVERDEVTRSDVLAVIIPVRNSRHKLRSEAAADEQVTAIMNRAALRSEETVQTEDNFYVVI
ncbi:hypothetical protein [Magnetospirillum sp. 64-120]|uniref:hypothetical protein n=1 Tax=Magnetospirillum sp. 64-120 TaxID=1895778 RepID=UPI0025C51266|nr:hypothetical protein [Magnetospirillum sp. 64-120]